MSQRIRIALLCLIVAAAFQQTFAAESGPLLGKPGKLLFEDDFARSAMSPKWKTGKGIWEVKDGVVTATEKAEDKHAAYAYINPNIEYKDIVAEYSFKFGHATKIHLMMEDNKYKGAHAGHIIRASIFPNQVELADMKFGNMKLENFEKLNDPKASAEEKKAIREKIKDKSAAFKFPFDPSEWHVARVEVVGDEMLLSIDGKVAAYFKSEGVDHPTKNMIGFTIGNQGEVRSLKVWEASTSPEWASRKSEVVVGLKK